MRRYNLGEGDLVSTQAGVAIFFLGIFFLRCHFLFIAIYVYLGLVYCPCLEGIKHTKGGCLFFFFVLVYPWFRQLVRGDVFWLRLQ